MRSIASPMHHHELRRVFETELVELAAIEQPPLIGPGLTARTGCFAIAFNSRRSCRPGLAPSLDGAHLFNDCQVRFEQSLALRRDLWTLTSLCSAREESASQAAGHLTASSITPGLS